MDKDQQLVEFTPIAVTAETLQMLSRQENYADLLALYMAYVEITTWQNGNNIRATNSFMMSRLHWGRERFFSAKKQLEDLGLVDTKTDRAEGKITKHYVLVRHVSKVYQKPQCGFDPSVVLETTNTNNYKENTNNSKTTPPKGDNCAPEEKEKSSKEKNQKPDETRKLFYLVMKQYRLTALNHNHIPGWCEKLKATFGEERAGKYLNLLLTRDLNAERSRNEFVPTLNRPLDIVDKAAKIIRYYHDTPDTFTPDDDKNRAERERLQEEEAERIRRGETLL